MKISPLFAALCAIAGSSSALAQNDVPAGSFPFAAKAGVDSHADKNAPRSAVNQGPFDMNSWKFGHALDAPANTPIWNPVKLKMMRGEPVNPTQTRDAGRQPIRWELKCSIPRCGLKTAKFTASCKS